MKLSNKVEAMQFSPIRKFNPIAQKAKDAGKKVYHLNIGQPDVETTRTRLSLTLSPAVSRIFRTLYRITSKHTA